MNAIAFPKPIREERRPVAVRYVAATAELPARVLAAVKRAELRRANG
jgi:hypothetical protein